MHLGGGAAGQSAQGRIARPQREMRVLVCEEFEDREGVCYCYGQRGGVENWDEAAGGVGFDLVVVRVALRISGLVVRGTSLKVSILDVYGISKYSRTVSTRAVQPVAVSECSCACRVEGHTGVAGV